MSRCIAQRKLLFSHKGSNDRLPLLVRVFEPQEVRPGEVGFDVAPGTARCTVSIEGLPVEMSDQIYGADSLQAVHLASDVEALLKRLTVKYDLFFPTGEAYFDEE